MGIGVEFNPDLALRRHGTPGRREDECLPARLEAGECYPFRKSGQRVYWFDGELPLLETQGNQRLSRPLASIRMITATHWVDGHEIVTTGSYRVIEVFDPKDPTIHFEGFQWRPYTSKYGRT